MNLQELLNNSVGETPPSSPDEARNPKTLNPKPSNPKTLTAILQGM